MLRKKLWVGASVAAALVAGAAVAAGPLTQAQAQEAAARNRIVSAYYAGWDVYGRGYNVKQIPADKLNVVQYAFGAPSFDSATGEVGCDVLDPWADYQLVHWSGDTSVDGVADNPENPNQHLFGNFNQLRKLKKKHPHLQVVMSLGGWTKSVHFPEVAATKQRRAAFVAACIDTFIKGNLPADGWPTTAGGEGAAAGVFDGIDVDWEYPTQKAGGNVGYGQADRHNATLLLKEFRRQLDVVGAANKKHYLLTAALPAAKSSTKYYELKEVSQVLDWANVMAYDFNVPAGPRAAPNTLLAADPRDEHAGDPTWNVAGTVAHYLRSGVPANKIVLGVPFYGTQYLRAKTSGSGLYQPFDSRGQNADSEDWDAKTQLSYHDIVDVAKILSSDGKGKQGFTRHWTNSSSGPWLFNPAQRHKLCGAFAPDGTCAAPYEESTSTVITYSDPRSIGDRVNLVRTSGLRGAMAWELSQDSDDHALMSQLAALLPR